MAQNEPNKPTFTDPLIIEPKQTPVPLNLGNLKHLVGTWTNENTEMPLGYNVMPLPQKYDSNGDIFDDGYILKNFSYFEEITFSAINGTAPNRGGTGTQVANTLLYEQRVYFGEGPNKNLLVHAENGTWLYLTGRKQYLGPYGTTDLPNSTIPTQKCDIAKQISIPHGNSILAVGTSQECTGQPNIIPISTVPHGVNTTQYYTKSVGNPNVEYTINPHQPLIVINKGLGSSLTKYIQINVETSIDTPPTNIGFEQVHARVTKYEATYWIEQLENSPNYDRLQYSQTITLELTINGKKTSFPHVTTNTLTRKVF